MMSEVMVDVLGPDRPLAYLSGPSFAMEIAQGLATAVTVASTDRDLGYDTMSMLTLTLTLTLPLPLTLTLTLTLTLPLPLTLTLTLTLSLTLILTLTLTLTRYDTMSMLRTRRFRGLYTNDVIGVEVCHLPYISLISPLYLPYISPIRRRGVRRPQDNPSPNPYPYP